MKILFTKIVVISLLAGCVLSCKDKETDADWTTGIAGTYAGKLSGNENGYNFNRDKARFLLERVDNKSLFLIGLNEDGSRQSPVLGPFTMQAVNKFGGEVQSVDEYVVLEGIKGESTLLMNWTVYQDKSKKKVELTGSFSGTK
ncbi:hypothetical protein DYBT9275_02478 [Dyadobacter sp. CECT 9275]|uniref:Uncharacterized protein n=1 Tax=Dyadobacter helix TaxID=2822344 RepID=A0A916NC97_9BACT|nr:hypothetical protein [Dyadobacter sp. CECT 9275]CAG5000509.1 hypothetical protein DYBT9275_02478 [Dyadobacter sp. CECT 9275]